MSSITLESLARIKCCAMGMRRFARMAPGGAENWDEVAQHPACDPSWRGWLAVHVVEATPEQRERWVSSSDDPAAWYECLAENAPNCSSDDRERWIRRSRDPEFVYGRCALFAEGVSADVRRRWLEMSGEARYWAEIGLLEKRVSAGAVEACRQVLTGG